MIITLIRITIDAENREEILSVARSLLGLVRAQPGCIHFEICHNIDDVNTLAIVEEWESQEDLDRYIRSDEYRKVLALIDFSAEPPEIRFNTVSHTGGLEVIEAARGACETTLE